MKFLLVPLVLLVCQAIAAPSTDSKILKSLQTKKSATVIVSLKANKVATLRKQVQFQKYSNRTQKINSLYSSLKNHADVTQAKILKFLNEEKRVKPIVVEQLWISNQIIVRNADYRIVERLLAMDEVAQVREERLVPRNKEESKYNGKIVHQSDQVPFVDEPWGVEAIRAPEIWATGNRGKGVVVGSIGSGVRVTHDALLDGYRADGNGNYGWYDPYSRTPSPMDDDGDGTHNMGIVLGRTKLIGVAREAQWIACRACRVKVGCWESELLICGQWMTCPTDNEGNNPDCSKAPHVVSNSWNEAWNTEMFYDDIVSAWQVANIVPIFPIGDLGALGCNSTLAPGNSENVIGVGATTKNNQHYYASAFGPTLDGNRIKPDIVAPGDDILSAHDGTDNSYSIAHGTHVACAHVVGLVTLLHSENPNLTYSQIKSALIAGAQPVNPAGEECGGISESQYPNHVVGYGIIDAVATFNAIKGL